MGHWIIRQTSPPSQRRTPRPPQAQTEAGMEMGMDTDEARVNRYAKAIYGGAEAVDPDEKAVILPAVIAVADEEQAELRAEVERLRWLSVIAGSGALIAEKRLAAVRALADEPGSGFPYVRVADLHAALAVPADAAET